ncbi:MAG TPA: amidohydrolase [Deltaproteobacteria bacterium]|nr:amidohydrolase [Deltaproteobacteria bacterium]
MIEVDTLISGGRILLMDKEMTIIPDGGIAVQGRDIVAVGDRVDIENRYRAAEVIDAAGGIVMPGLINGHTHVAMTCFRGMADDLPLMEWLNDYIFPAEAKNVNTDLAYWGSLLACAEMIRSGTTTFCDMYIFEDETAKAARQAGMRCLLGEVLFDFPSPNFKTPADGLAYTKNLLEKWADDDLVSIFVEPHALYTCSTPLLLDAKALADRYNAPLGIHLLENRSERAQLQTKLGQGAVPFLREIGLLNERLIAFHCVCMDDSDIKMFADHGCKVIHNPESNMKLASGVAPVPEMIAGGVCVGLGTDGCASNNNLDMFQEMDTAAKLHKVHRLDPVAMDARTVLEAATREGARALGMEHLVGQIKPGHRADIIIIDIHKPHLTPMYHEYSHLVYAVAGADVDTVLINGRVVMRNRRVLTIDENQAMQRVQEISARIKAGMRI